MTSELFIEKFLFKSILSRKVGSKKCVCNLVVFQLINAVQFIHSFCLLNSRFRRIPCFILYLFSNKTKIIATPATHSHDHFGLFRGFSL